MSDTFPRSLFVSESVCAGHPDKVCDQVSDAVLDAYLDADRRLGREAGTRVAVETLATRDLIVLAGEVTSASTVDLDAVVRGVIRDIGYTDPALRFSDQSRILVQIQKQSPEIARGVDDEGAGDQGLMFGYAVRETEELLPLPVVLAHALCEAVDEVRGTGRLPYLLPDGKSQVRVRYEGRRPVAVEHVTLAVPHRETYAGEQLETERVRRDLYRAVVEPVLAERGYLCPIEDFVLNGTGLWTQPGPAVDTGLTGRKIIVDTYGGRARHGGGAFSGKDPTKVDRSGAYAARYLARNVVAAGLADECEVRLAYVIGQRDPILRQVETFGTERESPERIAAFAWDLLDLSVKGIIDGLDLRRPIYRPTAAYGHFGRDGFPWEATAARPALAGSRRSPVL